MHFTGRTAPPLTTYEKPIFIVDETKDILGIGRTKKFSTPQSFGLEEFLLCIFCKGNGIIYIGLDYACYSRFF